MAAAVECDLLPPELDEDAKPDAKPAANAEELPLAVALAEELAEVVDWAIASFPLSVRTSKRHGNTNLLTLIMTIPSSLADHPAKVYQGYPTGLVTGVTVFNGG